MKPQLPVSEEGWMEYAACKGMDPDLWFPPTGKNRGIEAKRVCAVCTVRTACFNFAIEQGFAEGIWGGVSISSIRRRRHVA